MDNDSINEILDLCKTLGWEPRKRNGTLYTERGNIHIKSCPFCENDTWNFEISYKKDGCPAKCWACGKTANLTALRKRYNVPTGKSSPAPQPQRKLSSPPARDSGGAVAVSAMLEDQLPDKKLFEESWIEEYHQNLLKNNHGALDYLTEKRGFLLETIKHFKLGVKEDHSFMVKKGEEKSREKYPALVIPSFVTVTEKNGEKKKKIGLVQYRTIPPFPKAMSREQGMETVFFNEEALDLHRAGEMVICEGAMDAISVWQSGIKHVVGTTAGATSFTNKWIEQLVPYEKVILAYDADDPGRNGIEITCQRLGEERVNTVTIDSGKDMNELLVSSGGGAVTIAISSNKPRPIKNVHTMDSVINSMRDKLLMGNDLGRWIPWKVSAIQKITRDILPGNLIVLAGPPAAGKTTLGLDQAIFVAMEMNLPVLISCLEMTPEELLKMIIANVMSVKQWQIDIDILTEAYEILKNVPLYFEYHTHRVNFDIVLETMELSFKRYGIRFCLVDNLHYLARFARDELQEQGRISVELKSWAARRMAAVALIVHKKKPQGEAGISGGMDSWRGSAAVPADVDIGISLDPIDLRPKTISDLWENRDKDRPHYLPMLPVMVDKLRGARGGAFTWVYLEGDYSRFRDCTDEDFETLPEDQMVVLQEMIDQDGARRATKGLLTRTAQPRPASPRSAPEPRHDTTD